jgi:hypothetical protein
MRSWLGSPRSLRPSRRQVGHKQCHGEPDPGQGSQLPLVPAAHVLRQRPHPQPHGRTSSASSTGSLQAAPTATGPAPPAATSWRASGASSRRCCARRPPPPSRTRPPPAARRPKRSAPSTACSAQPTVTPRPDQPSGRTRAVRIVTPPPAPSATDHHATGRPERERTPLPDRSRFSTLVEAPRGTSHRPRSAGDQAVLDGRGGAGGTRQQGQGNHDEHHHAEEHHCPAHHRPPSRAGRQPRTSRWRGGRDGVATLSSCWPRQRFARPETDERRHLRVAPLVKSLGGDLRSRPAAWVGPSALEGLQGPGCWLEGLFVMKRGGVPLTGP